VTTPVLLDHHRETLLKKSAIADREIQARGYFTAERISDLKRLGFGEAQCNVPALGIPIWGPDGRINLYQSRPDTPRIGPQGKPVKYETPRKAQMALDVPPPARPYIRDPRTPLVATEGVKKGDSAISNGFGCALALLGVYNFRGINDDGGKTILAEFEYIALNGRTVYLVFDSDVMVKRAVYGALRRLAGFLAYRGAIVRPVYLPGGPNGEKVGLDDFFAAGHTRDEVLALAEEELRPPPEEEEREGEHRAGPYRATPKGIIWSKPTQAGPVAVPLTNFVAKIVGDVAEDDGAEVRRLLEVRAALGTKVRDARLTPERFAAMGWPLDVLGASALVYPGQAAKDHTRAAIQLLSGEVEERMVYGHTGWRERDGAWIYLHATGAIGAGGAGADVEVSLPDALTRYSLPTPPESDDLRAAIRASLGVASVAPESVTLPLLAATYRAALGGADFSLFLVGPTGIGKSELAALCQQHYGAGLDARHLPGSWTSTGNALEGLAFLAKDALLVVDDFAPTGNQADVQRYHRDAERILRAQGNRAGRQRMTADARLRAAKWPRGLVLATGEDVPRGQSARARALIIEVGPGDIRWDRLGERQKLAASGVYAAALAGFLRWVAPQYDTVRQRLATEAARLRAEAGDSPAHRRTPGIVGELGAAWLVLLDFATEVGAITAGQAASAWRHTWDALGKAAHAQARHQAASEPAARFLELLGSAIGSGRAHVADADGTPPEQSRRWGWRLVKVGSGEFERNEWRPQGARIGWVDDSALYLDRDAALAEVQKLGRDVGDGLAVTAQVLTKRLHERGLLVSTDQARGTLTIRRTLEGKGRAVLHLDAGRLLGSEETDKTDKTDNEAGA
jgi:hypothetical protein